MVSCDRVFGPIRNSEYVEKGEFILLYKIFNNIEHWAMTFFRLFQNGWCNVVHFFESVKNQDVSDMIVTSFILENKV